MRDQDKNRRRSSLDLNTMVYGKVPPQAKDLEDAVLGGILLVREAMTKVNDILKPECFYVEAHQRIYKAMVSVFYKSRQIDTLTIAEELRKNEELEMIGGSYYLTKLTNTVVSDAHIESHSRIIYEKYIQRELIRIAGNIIGDAYEDSTDVFDLLDLRDISTEVQSKKNVNVASVSIEVISSIHNKVHYARKKQEDPTTPDDPNEIFTLFPEWDRINGSLFPGLFIVAGRPGMGKGVVMTELICRMGMKYPVGVVNGEMTNKQLLIRIGCNLQKIDNELWKKDPTTVSDEELKMVYAAMQEAQCLQLHIEDSTYIHKITAKIRMWVQKYGVKAVLIDFLTLIRIPDEIAKRFFSEVQKLNYVMEVLRELSKELNVPIILFAQLNRELYKRGGNKEPNLSDLKGSGNIEEFAYQISFLHRPEYTDIMEDDLGYSTKGLIYQIIAKHRDGVLGRIKYKFSPQFSKIDNWDFQEVVGWKPSPLVGF